jgi:hypothetical protein
MRPTSAALMRIAGVTTGGLAVRLVLLSLSPNGLWDDVCGISGHAKLAESGGIASTRMHYNRN